MTSQPDQQTIAIQMLPNILGTKTNQSIKLGQLIKYNKRGIFLKNNIQKMRQRN